MKYTVNQRLVDNIILFLLIMSSGGLLFVFNRNLSSIIFLIILVFTSLIFSRKYEKRLVNSIFLTFFTVFFLGIVNFLFAITEQTINKYLFHCLTLVISLITIFHFYNNRSLSIFINRLYVVLKFISFHALFNFFIYFLVKNNLTLLTSTYHECETFLNIFFYSQERGVIDLFGFNFCRNQGLFWEPGILQIFLNILFFLEAFIIKKNKLVLFLVCFLIITTYSTTGIALLFVQIFFYIKNHFKKNLILIPLSTLILVPLYIIFNYNIDDKIKGERAASFQKRLFDLTQPLLISLDYPITGVGLDLFQFQKIRQGFYISSTDSDKISNIVGVDLRMETTDKGSTNSIMFLLATTGFPTTLLLLYMLYKQKLIVSNRKLWLFLFLIFIMSEPLLLRPFFFVFLMSGFISIFYKINFKTKLLA